jgi:hypothetical protein
MGKRRNFHTTRRFEDGLYRFLSSHINAKRRDLQMHHYSRLTKKKLRYTKSRDGSYQIYEKVGE